MSINTVSIVLIPEICDLLVNYSNLMSRTSTHDMGNRKVSPAFKGVLRFLYCDKSSEGSSLSLCRERF